MGHLLTDDGFEPARDNYAIIYSSLLFWILFLCGVQDRASDCDAHDGNRQCKFDQRLHLLPTKCAHFISVPQGNNQWWQLILKWHCKPWWIHTVCDSWFTSAFTQRIMNNMKRIVIFLSANQRSCRAISTITNDMIVNALRRSLQLSAVNAPIWQRFPCIHAFHQQLHRMSVGWTRRQYHTSSATILRRSYGALTNFNGAILHGNSRSNGWIPFSIVIVFLQCLVADMPFIPIFPCHGLSCCSTKKMR